MGSSTVSGKLVGGNLSLLASLSGTCFAPDYTGAVLVLEDVGEPPYKLDRKLTTLRLAGALRGLAALVLGDFNDAFQGNAAEEKEVRARVRMHATRRTTATLRLLTSALAGTRSSGFFTLACRRMCQC